MYGKNLTIWEDTLVTKILFNNGEAKGVEYLRGKNIYRADRDAARGDWTELQSERPTVMATREIILAAGAFNTPQLLMSSGIGPASHLEAKQVPVMLDRPGVGANLQDRYEVPVIDELDHEFALLDGCTFLGDANDRGLDDWRKGQGFYTTNGGTIAIMRRSGETKVEIAICLSSASPGSLADTGWTTPKQSAPGRDAAGFRGSSSKRTRVTGARSS